MGLLRQQPDQAPLAREVPAMQTLRFRGKLAALVALAMSALPFGHAAADEASAVPVSVQVADGFDLERVASAPLILHPIMAAFDDRGRLYVAENTGDNLDAKQLAARNPGRIRRLEDRDGDGRYDVAT